MKTPTNKQLMNARKKFIESKYGVEVYSPVTIFKKIIGYTGLTIGILTLPFPTGSVFLIAASAMLLGIDYKKLLNTITFRIKEVYYGIPRL